jgi:alpha-beta hydrolase superfamily lysophospholipase
LADVLQWSHIASDGYRWYYRHFPAATKPLARVVCVHGIQSHGGWYETGCRHLRDAGCDVFFLDRRGSGWNAVARGDAPSFRRLIDDLGEFLQTVRTPGLPLIVSAISWGGKLGAGICYRYPGLIDGLALLAPGFCPLLKTASDGRLKIATASVVSSTRMFPIPLNDPKLFTDNPERQRFIAEDPLALREATARFLVESIKLDVYLKRTPRHVTVPVQLLLAGKDRIIDNARTRRFVGRFATQAIAITEFPEAHHTLEFEPQPQAIFDCWTNWIILQCQFCQEDRRNSL